MKIAVSGKGGVGKTTLAALLAWGYAREGKRVIAVDADPDANLGLAMGFPESTLRSVEPVAGMKSLISERTGASPGQAGQWFILNPKVDDIPDKYALKAGNIWLLVMGGISRGGAGCACPENTVLKALLAHLVLERGDVVVLDMEAGLEHLGRGTARGVDVFLAVVEPGRRSFQTAAETIRLARELGVARVLGVGNKVRTGDEEAMRERAEAIGLDLLGMIPFDRSVQSADALGLPAWEAGEAVRAAAEQVRKKLLGL